MIFEVLCQDLDVQAAGGENDRLDAVLDQLGSHLPDWCQGGLPDPEFPVDDWRIVEDEGFGCRRRPALSDKLNGPLQEPLRVLLGIGDRR